MSNGICVAVEAEVGCSRAPLQEFQAEAELEFLPLLDKTLQMLQSYNRLHVGAGNVVI